jgi:hypothetical protein
MIVKLVLVKHYPWNADELTTKTLTCVNHLTGRWTTKHIWYRNLHFVRAPDDLAGECDCPLDDLAVIVTE